MKSRIVPALLVAIALPAAAIAQDTTLAGWTFSQFTGEGFPSINADTFESTTSIVATYRGAANPDVNEVDGSIVINNGGPGYTNPSIGTWSFANFNVDNAVDVRSDTFGALNTQNSTTLDGKQMHLTDSAGMMLTFNQTNTLWSLQVQDTAAYSNAVADDFTFAARGNGGVANVEWLYNGSVFATSEIAAGSFTTYGFDLPAAFYGTGTLEGRLVSGSVSFDNVQVNGALAAIPEPSSFAALAGLAGVAAALNRRRRK